MGFAKQLNATFTAAQQVDCTVGEDLLTRHLTLYLRGERAKIPAAIGKTHDAEAIWRPHSRHTGSCRMAGGSRIRAFCRPRLCRAGRKSNCLGTAPPSNGSVVLADGCPVARHAATAIPASLLYSPDLIGGTIPSFVVARPARDAREERRCQSRIKQGSRSWHEPNGSGPRSDPLDGGAVPAADPATGATIRVDPRSSFGASAPVVTAVAVRLRRARARLAGAWRRPQAARCG